VGSLCLFDRVVLCAVDKDLEVSAIGVFKEGGNFYIWIDV